MVFWQLHLTSMTMLLGDIAIGTIFKHNGIIYRKTNMVGRVDKKDTNSAEPLLGGQFQSKAREMFDEDTIVIVEPTDKLNG